MKSSLKDEDSVRSQLEEIKIKMEEMENNKRNNLIVYGIPNDIRETHSSLHQKVCLHLTLSLSCPYLGMLYLIITPPSTAEKFGDFLS